MRIVFIGCVKFSKVTLEKLITLKADIVGIVTKSTSSFNSDFFDLTDIAIENQIPFKTVNDINHPNNVKWINELNPDIIFCFGWSSLIKSSLLQLAPMGVLGYHPALLPENRGRHPLIWAKVLGLNESGSTFFFMDENADTGEILDQKSFPIFFEDDAETLYEKMLKVALAQIVDFLPLLNKNQYPRVPQNQFSGNVWRKRGKNDGLIDFRMTTNSICNLVRGLTKPYVGAHCSFNGEDIKIWKVKPGNSVDVNLEPGKVLANDKKIIEVKTSDGSILILEHEFKYLPQINNYII